MFFIVVIFMVMQVYFLKALISHNFQTLSHREKTNPMAAAFYKMESIADQIKDVLPATSKVLVVTDFDKSRDPGMYSINALAYHLYPIDAKGLRSKEVDCHVFLEKNDWKNHVPKGFSIIEFNERNGVACRKEAEAL